MTIFARNKVHWESLSHNSATTQYGGEYSDHNNVSILNCVDQNLLKKNQVTVIMKLVINKNLITKVAHQAVNRMRGMQFQLSVGGMMWNGKLKSGSWVSPSGIMSILNIIKILHVCVLVQTTHNNLYCMGIGNLNSHTTWLPAGF
jgi:hypothetical protein